MTTDHDFPGQTIRAVIFDADMREVDAWTYRTHVASERRDAARRIKRALASGHGVWTKAVG